MRVAKLPGAVTIFGEPREKSRLPRDVPGGISQVKRGIWSRVSMLRAVAARAG